MQFLIKMLFAGLCFWIAQSGIFNLLDIGVQTSTAVVVLASIFSVAIAIAGILFMVSAIKSLSGPAHDEAKAKSKAKIAPKASTKKSKDKRSTKSGS